MSIDVTQAEPYSKNEEERGMPIDQSTMTAWRICNFCGRNDEEIASIILDGMR